jgi:hypothetical protein
MQIQITWNGYGYRDGGFVAQCDNVRADGRTAAGSVRSMLRYANRVLGESKTGHVNPAAVEQYGEVRKACLAWLKEQGA